MFDDVMKKIADFLENTPKDIYEFSIWLEDTLVDDYDAMAAEQPRATYLLGQEVPDICASAEPGMKAEEVAEFKRQLKVEYDKALLFVV
ncbi:hypothetical protein JavanS175_0001 [Streptococcus satellite phage Javan175]|uniref:hypothetical protein n=1 Tax=Streptococcus entericus TaxID=155680 RepID=UPI000361C01F|nr:hypothetical protein [Streptococcus entericus]QBX07742.1 hypothetical protein JavanS175_0001 [Streptococcus satellite phage Javan175]